MGDFWVITDYAGELGRPMRTGDDLKIKKEKAKTAGNFWREKILAGKNENEEFRILFVAKRGAKEIGNEKVVEEDGGKKGRRGGGSLWEIPGNGSKIKKEHSEKLTRKVKN